VNVALISTTQSITFLVKGRTFGEGIANRVIRKLVCY